MARRAEFASAPKTSARARQNSAPPEKSGLDMLINFGLDSAELDTTARAELGEFAKALKDDRLSTLVLRRRRLYRRFRLGELQCGTVGTKGAIGDSLPDLQRRRSLPASRRSAWARPIHATPTPTIQPTAGWKCG